MAHVKVNHNKNGDIISYRFYASVQNEVTGKNEIVNKTVSAPVGLTPGRALKQMQIEADAWEQEVKKGNAPEKRCTFKYFIEEQFLPVFVRNGSHSPSTVAFYQNICEKLVSRFGHKKLDSIKSIDIETYLTELTKTKYKKGNAEDESTYKASYVNQFRKVLTVAFNFADKHGMIEKNPVRFISAVKKDRTEVDFLSEAEAKKFLTCLNKDASLYWKTAMNMLIRCGLRRGELAGLKWSDVNYEKQTLTVCRDVINNNETGRKNLVKETKTANSNRELPIDPVLMQMLKAWRKEQSEQFGSALMPSAFIFGKMSLMCYENRTQIKREELYKKVWENPVSKVAKEYGLTDNALRKRCINLNVPVPDRGYWAKIKAGQEVEKPELPEQDYESGVADPYSPIRPDSITQWLYRFNQTHGLHMVSPHDLRHTCATLLLSNGASVKETQVIMGHSDASTTLKYYCGTDMDALKNASDRLSQALAMGE